MLACVRGLLSRHFLSRLFRGAVSIHPRIATEQRVEEAHERHGKYVVFLLGAFNTTVRVCLAAYLEVKRGMDKQRCALVIKGE